MYAFINVVLVWMMGTQASAAEPLQVRYMEFETRLEYVEEGDAWKNRSTDCGPLIHELLTLVENRKAKVEVDECVDIVELDKDYLVNIYYESNICHAVSSNGVVVLKEWPESTGAKKFVRKTYYPSSKGKKLVFEFWVETKSLKKREEFKPQPYLLAGEPVVETSRIVGSSFYWENERPAWFLGHGGVDGLATISVCQVSRARPAVE